MGSLLFSTGRTDISRNPGRWQPTSPWSNTILRALGVLSTSGERQSLACLLLALGMGSNLASKLLRESRWTQVSKRKDAVGGGHLPLPERWGFYGYATLSALDGHWLPSPSPISDYKNIF